MIDLALSSINDIRLQLDMSGSNSRNQTNMIDLTLSSINDITLDLDISGDSIKQQNFAQQQTSTNCYE